MLLHFILINVINIIIYYCVYEVLLGGGGRGDWAGEREGVGLNTIPYEIVQVKNADSLNLDNFAAHNPPV